MAKERLKSIFTPYESLFIDDYLTKSIFDLHSNTVMAILEQREKLLQSDPVFKVLGDQSKKRQDRIDVNITKALQNEKYTRAVVIYGLTHRPAIVRAIQKIKVAKILELNQALQPKVPAYFERERFFTLPGM